MLLLMDPHSGFPVHYNNDERKKSGQTIHAVLFNASVCWNISIYSIITRVLMAREHRWDLNSTCWYLCLNYTPVSVCQFKHLRARGRSLAPAVICACTHQKRANIKLSLKYCVWMEKFTQKLCQNARLGKYPIADIAGWTYSISAFS